MFYPTFYPNSCYGSNQHQLRYPVPPCNNSQVVSQVVPTTSYFDGPWFNPVHYTNTIVEPVPYFTTEVPPLTQQVFQRPPIKIRMKPQPSSCTMATLYSHKIFVGSLAKDTSPQDLVKVFSKYGTVIEAKVIVDGEGVSKGFGFVSFPTPDPVEKVLQSPTIYIEGKRIVVASAIRKQHMDGEK